MILSVSLVCTLHASTRQKSGTGALVGPNTHSVAIALSTSSSSETAVVKTSTQPSATAGNHDPAHPSRSARSTARRSVKRVRAYTEEQVQALIRTYANSFGLDAELPLAIARCESQFQWNAANPGSTARGVYQYVASTWRRTPEGKRGTSALDAEANIRMAILHIATIGTSPWKASRACWGSSGPETAVETVALTTTEPADDEADETLDD